MKKWIVLALIGISLITGFVLKDEIRWAYYGKMLDYGMIKMPKDQKSLPAREEPSLIAHGGGDIDGSKYTNSQEAVNNSLKNGFHYVEIDLRKSLEGHYFGAHKYKEFNALVGNPKRWMIPPTEAGIKESKIEGKYTPILLRELPNLLKAHPDAYLVTDKARDFKALLKEFPYPDRLVVEVSNRAQYYDALKAGILYPVMQSSDFDSTMKEGIKRVVISKNAWDSQKAENFIAHGGQVFVASFKTLQEIPDDMRRKGVFVYLDQKQ